MNAEPDLQSIQLQFGLTHELQIAVIEPFFEEANRMRRLIASIMRLLDRCGIGTTLLGLPGAGESEMHISSIRLADWRAAVSEMGQTRNFSAVASFRAGALLDDALDGLPAWRFAPETGARLVRDLKRTRLASRADSETLYAGHALSDAFLADLDAALPRTDLKPRTVRLNSDPLEADLKINAAPLWRRAEPGDDPALAALLAEDIDQWVRQCVS